MPAELTVLAVGRSTSGSFFGELLAGLGREVGAAGGRLVVVQTLDPDDLTTASVERPPTFDLPVAWDDVDGVVAVSLAAGAPYLRAARAAGKPVVLTHRVDGFAAPLVLPDNRGGARTAVQHLVEHGHTRIGFVGDLAQDDMRERYEGYREALAAHGLTWSDDLFFRASDDVEAGGRRAADAVAAAPDRPTALVVATDRNAFGLLAGLTAAGLRVPQDVALVSFDNTDTGAISTPTLSSVDQRFDEVGALAGRLLLESIRGGDPGVGPHVHAATGLAARGSCGCAPRAGTRSDDAPGDGVETTLARWRGRASTYLRRSQRGERLLDEQFRIAAALLDTSGADPRDLAWLTGTHVRAGVLALWHGDPADRVLDVVGVYDAACSDATSGTDGPERADATAVGARLPVTAFPPPALVRLARPEDGQACFVVPVRTRDHDWGLLTVVGDIDTTSPRDTYRHWAALLCSAFEAEALGRTSRANQQRYALITQAAREGIWEWDGAAASLYLSERCREVVGLTDGRPSRSWMEHVHPDDRAPLHDVIVRASALPGVPAEIELRIVGTEHDERWLHLRCVGVGPEGGPVERLVGSVSDIQRRKSLEEQLRRNALVDPVTGLPNRRLFLDRLTHALAQRSRGSETHFAVLFLDLDGFKLVNDSLGHLAGDELLAVVADRLRDGLRAADTAARFGGDEFAVLLSDPEPDEVLGVVERLQVAIAAPVTLGDSEVVVTASVGVTTSWTEYADASDVLRDADTAMYHAKAALRGSASVFDPEMHVRASNRLRLRTELRNALAHDEFVVHYQPIVALGGGALTHVEALVRWQHPSRGLQLPGVFLPVLEGDAAIVTLGRWLLDEVCRQIAVWRADGADQVRVSVNVSHREFWSRGLVDAVAAALARHRVPARCLVLEITESVIMSDLDAARDVLGGLRALGVRAHIDDFGTGSSSLHALHTLPLDGIKLDGSFVRALADDVRTSQLVAAVLTLGDALGLDVVAEWVETQGQADQLVALGCRHAQGWLYARALPGDEVAGLLGTDLTDLAARADVAAGALLARTP